VLRPGAFRLVAIAEAFDPSPSQSCPRLVFDWFAKRVGIRRSSQYGSPCRSACDTVVRHERVGVRRKGDHTSALKLIETKWNLPALTYRDTNASNLLDSLHPQLASAQRITSLWCHAEPIRISHHPVPHCGN